jgi:hypothetical protein
MVAECGNCTRFIKICSEFFTKYFHRPLEFTGKLTPEILHGHWYWYQPETDGGNYQDDTYHHGIKYTSSGDKPISRNSVSASQLQLSEASACFALRLARICWCKRTTKFRGSLMARPEDNIDCRDMGLHTVSGDRSLLDLRYWKQPAEETWRCGRCLIISLSGRSPGLHASWV